MHTRNPISFFLSFWHLEQVYWERQIPCISLCAVCQCSVCDLRGVYISIVNQTKQRLCQWCKHRELNLPQFTARSSPANLTVQEIKSLLNYSICFPCRTMRADIIYNWRFSSTISTVSLLQRGFKLEKKACLMKMFSFLLKSTNICA